MAALLFAARIDSMRPLLVSSAGTAGVTGFPMDASAARVLRELGADGRGHVARRLTRELIAESDLILTGETCHRSSVVLTDPLAFRRAFTLREFGRLAAGLVALPDTATEDLLRIRVLEIASQRGQAPVPDPDDDEISDPFGGNLRVMRARGQEITDAVDAVVAALRLAPLSDPARECAGLD